MNSRLSTFASLRIIVVALAVAYVYLFCFRQSVAFLGTHFQGRGDYRTYLKLFWALIFTFAVCRNFRRLGLKLPRCDSLWAGVLAPVALVLISYYAIGYYFGWDGSLVLHNLCVAAAEELLFNGCLLAMLRPLGIRHSAYIAGLVFSTFHFYILPGGWFSVDALLAGTIIFATSVFVTGIRYYSDSLLPGIIIHFLLDYLINFYPGPWAISVTAIGYAVWEWIVFSIFMVYGLVLLIKCERRESAEEIRVRPGG